MGEYCMIPLILALGVAGLFVAVKRGTPAGPQPVSLSAGQYIGEDPGQPGYYDADVARALYVSGVATPGLTPGFALAGQNDPYSNDPTSDAPTTAPSDVTYNQGAASYPSLLYPAHSVPGIDGPEPGTPSCCAPAGCGPRCKSTSPYNVRFIDGRDIPLLPEWIADGIGYDNRLVVAEPKIAVDQPQPA